MPECARVCQNMSEYARVCQSIQGYARVCQSMPEYAKIYQSMPEHKERNLKKLGNGKNLSALSVVWKVKPSSIPFKALKWSDQAEEGANLISDTFGLPKFQFRLVYNWRLNLKNFVQNLQFSPILSTRVYLSCTCCRTTSHAHYITETGPLIDPETTARSNTFPVSNWVSESLPRIKIQWQGKGVPGPHELRPGHVFRLD